MEPIIHGNTNLLSTPSEQRQPRPAIRADKFWTVESDDDTTSDETYLLGTTDDELARLIAQAEIHRPETETLFDRVGIRTGDRVLDIGCGPLCLLDLLSERVGATGEVFGLDASTEMLRLAQRSIAARGVSNVTLIQGDAVATTLPDNSFDFVHERLLLINLASPQDAVAEMARITHPGGWVVLENADWLTWTCEPPHPAWEKLRSALGESCRAAGLDMFLGRRLPELLRTAGLVDVGVSAHCYVWHSDDILYHVLPKFLNIQRQRIMDNGILSQDDLDQLLGELENHLSNPDTFVIHPLFFQAWGRKPGVGDRIR